MPAAPSSSVGQILRSQVRPKLRVGAVNDPAEIEADRVADQIMRMPAPENAPPTPPPIDNAGTGPPPIRRKCAACDDEDKIQRKAQTGTQTPPGYSYEK